MLDYRVVPAAERLTQTEFSRRREYVDHRVDIGIYTCPHCAFRVQLQTSDLQKHEASEYSNLSQSIDAAIERFRPLRSTRFESFLDFSCPRCGAPVRLVYEPTDEWAMGAHGWRITDIIEARDWRAR